MTAHADRVEARQTGDYRAPVLAPARGGKVPVGKRPASVDNGGNDKGTATPSPVTEESG